MADIEINLHFLELTESQKKAINDVIEAMWENNKKGVNRDYESKRAN